MNLYDILNGNKLYGKAAVNQMNQTISNEGSSSSASDEYGSNDYLAPGASSTNTSSSDTTSDEYTGSTVAKDASWNNRAYTATPVYTNPLGTVVDSIVRGLTSPSTAYADELNDNSSNNDENQKKNEQQNASFSEDSKKSNVEIINDLQSYLASQWLTQPSSSNPLEAAMQGASTTKNKEQMSQGNWGPYKTAEDVVSAAKAFRLAEPSELANSFTDSDIRVINSYIDNAKKEDNFDWASAVQDYMQSRGGDYSTWDFNTDYNDLAMNGDKDIWRGLIQSSDAMQKAYMDDYSDIDANGNGKIDDDEANDWYDKMKAENIVNEYLDIASGGDIVNRIFGNNAGTGFNNSIIDALNNYSSRLSTKDSSTLEALVSNGILKIDDEGNIIGLKNLETSDGSESFADAAGILNSLKSTKKDGSYDANAARLSNATKLSSFLSLLSDDDTSNDNLVSGIDNAGDMANYVTNLLNNVSGGDSGIKLVNKDPYQSAQYSDSTNEHDFLSQVAKAVVDQKNAAYDTSGKHKTSGYHNATPTEYSGNKDTISDNLISSGGSNIDDNVAYLLLNNLQYKDAQGNTHTLAGDGYSLYRRN